jgi:hypothetical protein
MKKLIFAAVMAVITSACLAQSNGMFVTLRVTDSIWLNSKWIKQFSDDSTMGTGASGIIPTQKAVKSALVGYVQQAAAGAPGGLATLDENGKVPLSQLMPPTTIITKSTTLTDAHEIVYCNGVGIGPSGTIVTLPDAAGRAGKMYTLKRTNTGSVGVISAGGTIDGASSYGLATGAGNEFVTFISDGTNWKVVSKSYPPAVTGVGLSMPDIFTVSGSPVTSTGTLSASLVSQNQNLVFASPIGASGTPTFRPLAASDLPDLSGNYIQANPASTQTANIDFFGTLHQYGGSFTSTKTGDNIILQSPTRINNERVTMGISNIDNYSFYMTHLDASGSTHPSFAIDSSEWFGFNTIQPTAPYTFADPDNPNSSVLNITPGADGLGVTLDAKIRNSPTVIPARINAEGLGINKKAGSNIVLDVNGRTNSGGLALGARTITASTSTTVNDYTLINVATEGNPTITLTGGDGTVYVLVQEAADPAVNYMSWGPGIVYKGVTYYNTTDPGLNGYTRFTVQNVGGTWYLISAN